jgi:hypothetical protein
MKYFIGYIKIMIHVPTHKPTGRPPSKPLLRSDIEEAQAHTNSNLSAARWLKVSYRRYKKYAVLYNLFDSHLNPTGIGVDKGFSKKPTNTPLRDILANKHPKYSPAKLKNRLVARRKLVEECNLCGMNEKRIGDNKTPLMINFIDGNHSNFSLSNLNLLCYNCMFLTTGAPTVVNKNLIEKSIRNPKSIPANQNISTVSSDYIDIEEDKDSIETWDIELTEEEKQELLKS